MRKKIAVFMDQFELFNGNILENITFLEDKSLAHITDILKIIGLEDFVNKLPEGLHFQINSNNNTLPTHIRKKILLCRTLLLDAKLYILENPFEFLDENACIQILEYLRHKEATVIITSYNDSYKNLFDKTIELK
jgi:ABC-type multidrug transport system fused ATPase/permease subunit